MTARFYAPDARAEGQLVTLPAEEASHLTRVLRLRSGSPVIVFDGRGHEFQGIVQEAGQPVTIRLGPPHAAAPEVRVAITLAQAVLKGDKMDDVVRDAVMMGVAAIQPVVTAHTEATLAAIERGRRQERWQRIAVSSAKQCGRAVVPPLSAPIPLDELWRGDALRVMLVEPSAGVHAIAVTDLNADAPAAATVIVGPEGGWAPEELARAAAHCQFLRIGSRTLRADAVPIVALTSLLTTWKQLD